MCEGTLCHHPSTPPPQLPVSNCLLHFTLGLHLALLKLLGISAAPSRVRVRTMGGFVCQRRGRELGVVDRWSRGFVAIGGGNTTPRRSWPGQVVGVGRVPTFFRRGPHADRWTIKSLMKDTHTHSHTHARAILGTQQMFVGKSCKTQPGEHDSTSCDNRK